MTYLFQGGLYDGNIICRGSNNSLHSSDWNFYFLINIHPCLSLTHTRGLAVEEQI